MIYETSQQLKKKTATFQDGTQNADVLAKLQRVQVQIVFLAPLKTTATARFFHQTAKLA